MSWQARVRGVLGVSTPVDVAVCKMCAAVVLPQCCARHVEWHEAMGHDVAASVVWGDGWLGRVSL